MEKLRSKEIKKLERPTRSTNFSISQFLNFSTGGFTLLEVLVSAAVLIVVSLVIVSGLFSFREASALNQAVDDALGLLREGRSKTLGSEGGVGYGVRFDVNAVTLFKTGVYNPADPANVTVNLPNLVEISAITLNTTTASVYFERLTGATKSCGAVKFHARRSGKTRNIHVLPSGSAVANTSTAVPSGCQ